MTIAIRSTPFPDGAGDLLAKYSAGHHDLDDLYPHYPLADPPRPPDKATTSVPLDGETANRIRALNEKAGAGDATLRHLDLLEHQGTRFVIAGQQPGLLLGPPYSVYKMFTVAALARRWSKETGRRVIPLFWIASHDADLPEIDHIRLPATGGEPRKIRLALEGVEPRTQVGAIPIPKTHWLKFLDELEDALPGTEFRGFLIEALASIYAEDIDFCDLFARMVHRFLPDSGLVLFDGRDAETAEAARPVLAAAARNHGALRADLDAGEERLKRAGLTPPLGLADGRALFFLLDGNVRVPVRIEEDALVPEDGVEIGADDLAERIEEGTIRATPNAALRPLVQDSVFPNLATVVGHSELLYHAEIGPLYERLGVPRPMLIPRTSLTLVHFRTADLMEKLGLSAGELRHPVTRGNVNVDEAAAAFERAVQQELATLIDAVEDGAPGSIPPEDPVRQRLTKEAARTVDRVRKLADKAGENRAGRIHRMRLELFPADRPQEMVTSLFHVMARYGAGILGHIEDQVEPGRMLPQLLTIDPRGNTQQ